MSVPSPRSSLLLLLAAGLSLWAFTFLGDRPIFLDEANVARNLHDRSFIGLLRPLDYEQYAPPLYLFVGKVLGELFGYREWALRLPALLGGLVGVFAVIYGGRQLRLGYWLLLPLGLLFANPTVLRYVTEVKPYGSDLGVAALLIACHVRAPGRNYAAWAIAGMIAPWVSLPSIFVLAVVGLLRIFRDQRFVGVTVLWLASFLLLYHFVLSPAVGSRYLNDFHRTYFMPLPTDGASVRQAFDLGVGLLRLSFGYTAVALLWGTGMLLSGVFLKDVRRSSWLLLPLLLCVVASHLRFYTLIERLMLFALPGIWLFASLAARSVWQRSKKPVRWVHVVCALLTIASTNIYRAVQEPYRFSDSRRLAEMAASNPYVADGSAVPVLDYYLRVRTGGQSGAVVARPDPKTLYYRGGRRILFDGTTDADVREARANYERRAAERGCRTTWEPLFRSGSLYVICPEPNYDR